MDSLSTFSCIEQFTHGLHWCIDFINLNIDILHLGYDFINMKSKSFAFFQFIFMIKHACYTCTYTCNDTSRTEYGYDNFSTFQYFSVTAQLV